MSNTVNFPPPDPCELCKEPMAFTKCPDAKWRCVNCCDHDEHTGGRIAVNGVHRLDNDSRFVIDPPTAEGPVAVMFVEYLAWHRDYFFGCDEMEDWAKLTDDEGWLTDEAKRILAAVLTSYVNRPVEVEVGYGGDDPHFVASYTTDRKVGDAVNAAFDDAWSFIAACINLSNPGTAGWNYMFQQVLDGLAKEK